MPGRARRLVIMAKEPRMGRVKSRLGRFVGAVAATRFQRVALERLVRRMSADARWQTIVAVAPDTAVTSMLLPDGDRMPQGDGTLGDRMARAFGAFPYDTVLIVGADIPGMMPRHVARAFSLAERHGAVLGPSGDGGYWCIGLVGGLRPPELFKGVRWSTEHALEDTLARLPSGRVARADELTDVDDEDAYADWRRAKG